MRSALLVLLSLLVLAPAALAGGSAETTLVVVNDDSPLSKQVANHYVKLRGIPSTHVCRVSGIPNLTVITLAQYQERIWGPISKFLDEHKLWEEIDTVALSADFPFGVDYRADIDVKADRWKKPPYKFHVASITSLIYLHRNMADHAYLNLGVNRYARNSDIDPRKAHGFRSRYVWSKELTPKTDADDDAKTRYLLAVMLAATGIQGNTTPEVLACLDRGAASDGTQPKGRIYMMENKNVRATTRMPMFDALATQLARLIPEAVRLKQGEEGQDGKLPIGKDDVMGCVAGTASCNWVKSKSTMLPGAIVEHLTSFGGKLDGSGQTKLTEFIRHGATGTSGTVTEPFAIPHKFPLPFIHGYYAEGSSLAEAFYQSMMGPYQLLVLGEPLARPYAKFAKVKIAAPDTKAPWTGTVEVKADVKMPKDVEPASLELWVDGQLVAEEPAGEALTLDTTTLDDGVHDVRLVVVEDTMIETRSAHRAEITIKNTERDDVTIRLPKKAPTLDDEIQLKGKAKGGRQVELFVGSTSLGTAKVKSSSWKLKIPATRLGLGEVELVARATYSKGPAVRSTRVRLVVNEPKPPKPAKKKRSSRRKKKKKKKDEVEAPKPAKPGAGLWCVVTLDDGKQHGFASTLLGRKGKNNFLKQLRAKAKGKIAKITLTGELEVKTPGLYRLAVNAMGKLQVIVNGQSVLDADGCAFDRQTYAAVALEAGWIPLQIEYEPTGNGDLWIMRGGPVVSAFLEGKELRHE